MTDIERYEGWLAWARAEIADGRCSREKLAEGIRKTEEALAAAKLRDYRTRFPEVAAVWADRPVYH